MRTARGTGRAPSSDDARRPHHWRGCARGASGRSGLPAAGEPSQTLPRRRARRPALSARVGCRGPKVGDRRRRATTGAARDGRRRCGSTSRSPRNGRGTQTFVRGRRHRGADQSTPRPGDRDVEEPPLLSTEVGDRQRFADPVGAQEIGLEQGAATPDVWPDVRLHARNDDDVPLQALAAVRRHHPHSVTARPRRRPTVRPGSPARRSRRRRSPGHRRVSVPGCGQPDRTSTTTASSTRFASADSAPRSPSASATSRSAHPTARPHRPEELVGRSTRRRRRCRSRATSSARRPGPAGERDAAASSSRSRLEQGVADQNRRRGRIVIGIRPMCRRAGPGPGGVPRTARHRRAARAAARSPPRASVDSVFDATPSSVSSGASAGWSRSGSSSVATSTGTPAAPSARLSTGMSVSPDRTSTAICDHGVPRVQVLSAEDLGDGRRLTLDGGEEPHLDVTGRVAGGRLERPVRTQRADRQTCRPPRGARRPGGRRRGSGSSTDARCATS